MDPGGGSRRRADPEPARESSECLFVYGTLQRSQPGNWRLGRARFVAEAVVRGSLLDLGRYPALVLGDDGLVRGEVWECPVETLRSLDAYEGVEEGLFERTQVPIDGRPCWTYVAGPKLRSATLNARRVPDGVWRGPNK